MASRNVRSRAVWFWPLVAFLVGLLVGWLVIGWALWPVTWKNTLPQDLRPAERDAYLAMVAESLAASGDTTMAQERLASWPSDLLAVDLGRLQGRFAREDAVQAEQVQTLASALGLDVGATAPGQAAAARPSAGSSPFSGIQWRTVCTTGLWVLLILLGVAAIVLLYRRWRASQLREAAPATAPAASDEHSWRMVGGSKSAESAGDTEAAWSQSDAEGEISPRSSIPPWEEDEAIDFEEEDLVAPPPRSVSQRVDQPSQAALAASASAAATATGTARPAGAPVPSGALTKVSEVRALYQMGEPDYDEAFDVKDAGGAYIGECGVALVDPVGRGHDQAAALQVWLWDKTDPDTKVKVLMGEGAYRDTAMRDQLAKDQPSIAVKPGATFELDSYNLLLRGMVEKLDYADLEPAYGVFAELQLLLQVFRKG